MGNGVISLIAAIGAGAWIFNKMQRRSGGLTQQSLIATAAVTVVIFIGLFVVLGAINK